MADTASERVVEDIARAFHEAYESLAPQFGYETREDSRVPWDEVPERNRALMVKTVEALIELGVITPTAPLLRWLGEQAKATRDEHRNFRSGYDEGRFDAFGAVEAHIEGGATREPVGDGERATGLRRGHLADLEVIEAILRSDPREEASEYAANPKSMADAVRNMIEDPDLHNPESPGPIVFEVEEDHA